MLVDKGSVFYTFGICINEYLTLLSSFYFVLESRKLTVVPITSELPPLTSFSRPRPWRILHLFSRKGCLCFPLRVYQMCWAPSFFHIYISLVPLSLIFPYSPFSFLMLCFLPFILFFFSNYLLCGYCCK